MLYPTLACLELTKSCPLEMFNSVPKRTLKFVCAAARAKFLFCTLRFNATPNKLPTTNGEVLSLRLPSRLATNKYFFAGTSFTLKSTVSVPGLGFCSTVTNRQATFVLKQIGRASCRERV